MRYFISLSFNGSPFCGWQIQNNANSVQAELQRALSLLLKEQITVTGAGRTDSGVNALNYIAHFDSDNSNSLLPSQLSSDTDIPIQDYMLQFSHHSALHHNRETVYDSHLSDYSSTQNSTGLPEFRQSVELKTDIQKVDYIIYKLNAILNKAIRVNSIFRVNDSMHARFDAKSRTYRYYIHTIKDPFGEQFSYYYPLHKLDFKKMNIAAAYFLGCKDFSSLQKAHSDTKTAICTVTDAFWKECDFPHPSTKEVTCPIVQNKYINEYYSGRYVFTVTADRFLRNMVRAMVGSLIEVGSGKRSPEWIADMLAAKNRSSAGNSVPGHALFLTNIRY